MRSKGMTIAGLVLLLVIAGAVVAGRTGSGSVGNEASTALTAPAPDFASGRQVTGATAGDAKVLAPTGVAAGSSASAAGQSSSTPAAVAGAGSGTVDPAGPRIVRTADVAVKVEKGKFGAAFDRVNAVATSYGGYVTSSSTATTGDEKRARSGQLTVRVPSEKFEDVRAALGQLGEVENQAIRGEDVSGQLVDYDARIRSLQAQEDSLRTLVAKANTVGEVLQVQNSLFSVRQQIEQLQAQRAQLDQAATLATIQVSLYEPGAAVVSQPEPQPAHATSLADSFRRAVDGAVSVVGGTVVVLGYLLPLAVLGLLGWGVWRLRHRGRGAATPAPVMP